MRGVTPVLVVAALAMSCAPPRAVPRDLRSGGQPSPSAPASATTPALGAVRFTSVRSPVVRGGTGRVAVATAPGAACSITVLYRSGQSVADGLEPRVAGPDGIAVWSWTVGAATTPGDWPIVVRCAGESARTSFVVR